MLGDKGLDMMQSRKQKKNAKRNVMKQAPKISEYNKHNKQEKKVNFRLIG